MTNTVDNFKWTDELVKEFCNWFTRIPANEVYKKDRFEEFKQLKSIPNKQDERIEVQHIAFTYDSDRVVKFQLSKPSTEEQLLLIKQAIEAAINRKEGEPLFGKAAYERLFDQNQELMSRIEFLQASEDANKDKVFTQSEVDTIREETWKAARMLTNPNFNIGCYHHHKLSDYLNSLSKPSTTPIEDKGWEILSVLDDLGCPVYSPSKDVIEAVLERNGERIHSVRRTSDNEVFTVGEYAYMVNEGYYKIQIKRFNIRGERMVAEYESINWADISGLSKEDLRTKYSKTYLNDDTGYYKNPPQPPQDKGNVLFTTEDGVEIRHGQNYWYVVSGWTPQMVTAQEFGRKAYQLSSLLRFSTKEAAEQYILENKPCLNVKDVMGYFRAYFEIKNSMNPTHGQIRDAMIEVAKQKLNQ